MISLLQQTKKLLGLNLLIQFALMASLSGFLFSPTPAHAQFGIGGLIGGAGAERVHVVADSSGNLVANQTTQFNTTAINAIQTKLGFKELTLDGIAWSLVKNVAQQMTSSIINWINSGFQGSPAFLTNLDRFLLDIADQTAGEFIYGSELNFLCEPIEFQVRVALELQYKKSGRGNYEPQCTLTDVSNNISNFLNGDFSQGGWPAFFELTVGSNNDPNKAFFSASSELNARIEYTQDGEKKLLEFGSGLFSMKVCDTVNDSNGQPREECDITTPGKVIEGVLTFEVGEKGSQTLLQADEFNEIVSALLGQLANQALSGANGLLGLGGNSRYSNNTFGSNSNQSFLSAIASEDISAQQDLSNNAIAEAISAEKTYANLQEDILDEIADVEDQLEEGESDYPSCFSLELSEELLSIKEDAEANAEVSYSTLEILENMNSVFTAAPATQKIAVLDVFMQLEDSGVLRTAVENEELRITFIEWTLVATIAEFEDEIDAEINSCD